MNHDEKSEGLFIDDENSLGHQSSSLLLLSTCPTRWYNSMHTMKSTFTASCLTAFGLIVIGAVVWAAMNFITGHLGVANGYWLVPVFGALGGMVGGFIRSENKLELCSFETPKSVNLGVVGDISVGLGGASALMFLFGGNVLNFDPRKAESLVIIVSITFVAGAFGRSVVELAGDKLLRKAKEEAGREARSIMGKPAAIILTQAARDIINEGASLEDALKFIRNALENDPKYPPAYVEQGRVFKRLGDLNKALEAVETALRLSPGKPEALYNRACYNALLNKSPSVVASDLSKAFGAASGLRKLAGTDPDLKSVLNSEEIKALLENPEQDKQHQKDKPAG